MSADPVIPLPLTWDQWGMILVPLYFFLILWMRFCLQSLKPTARKRKTKGAPNGNTR